MESVNRDPFAGRRSWPLSLLLLEIDVGERLPVVVADDEAGVRFPGGTWRRESGARAVLPSRRNGLTATCRRSSKEYAALYCAFGFSDGVGAVPVGAGFCFFFFFGGDAAGC